MLLSKLKNKKMEQKSSHISEVIEKTEKYIKTTTDLLRMQVIQKTAESVSGVVTIMILAIVFLHFFIFLNLSLALLVSTWVGNYFQGFLLFGMFYGLLFFILYIKRKKWLKIPIKEKIIEEALEDNTN
jgi:hypothetical protein